MTSRPVKRKKAFTDFERNTEEAFEYEKEFLMNHNKTLKCTKPGCDGLMKSAGKGGNVGRGGIQLLQVQCRTCFSKHRIASLITEDLLNEYRSKMDAFIRRNEELEGKQPTVDAFFKPKQQQINEIVDNEVSMEITKVTENSDWADVMPEEAEELDYKKMYERTKAELDQTKAELGAVVAEFEKFKNETRKMVRDEIAEALQKMQPTTRMNEPVNRYTGELNEPKPKQTFASIVKAQEPTAQIKKMNRATLARKVNAMTRPIPAKPARFEKIVFKVNDSRPLKKCKTFQEINQIVNGLFKAVGIKGAIFMWSKIGNSLIEIIVPEEQAKDVKWNLFENELNIIDEPKLWNAPPHYTGPWTYEKFVKRNAFLYRTARLNNLKECILRGVPDEIAEMILAQVDMDQAVIQEKIASGQSGHVSTNTAATGNGGAMDVELRL